MYALKFFVAPTLTVILTFVPDFTPLAMEILPPDTFTLLLFVAYATFALPFTPDTAIFFEVLFVLMPIHFWLHLLIV